MCVPSYDIILFFILKKLVHESKHSSPQGYVLPFLGRLIHYESTTTSALRIVSRGKEWFIQVFIEILWFTTALFFSDQTRRGPFFCLSSGMLASPVK